MTLDQAREAGPKLLCEDLGAGFCPASNDGYCVGGFEVDADDWLRCHG